MEFTSSVQENPQGYAKPSVWYAVLPHHEATLLSNGASTFGEACEMLYQLRAQGFEEAYILLTIRL